MYTVLYVYVYIIYIHVHVYLWILKSFGSNTISYSMYYKEKNASILYSK